MQLSVVAKAYLSSRLYISTNIYMFNYLNILDNFES